MRQENGQLRISTALIDRAGFQVWGETFVRETSGTLALQDEIAAAVATRIAPRTVPSALAGRQPDFEAYQHYVIGRELLVRRPVNFRRLARERLDRVVELDPGFAEAYAERAIALIFGAFMRVDREASFEQAQRDIDTALALNPDLAQIHAAQGFLLLARESPAYAVSEAPLRRTLALDPNLVNAWNWLHRALRAQGRHATVRGYFPARLLYGSLLALAGDYRPARKTLEAVLDPGVASQEIETTQETNARHALAWAWRHSGDGERANALLTLLDGHFRQQYSDGRLHRSSDLFDYARTAALRGETARALDFLEAAEAAGWRGYYGVLHDPRWDTVRGEPRFQALMARVKDEVDAQRTRVERLAAEDAFVTRLDAALASQRTMQSR